MFIAVGYEIADIAKFWGISKSVSIPDGLKLHSTLPGADCSKMNCLWEPVLLMK
ncbi:MAG: hypothetical protein IH874_06250 [Candidatus Dadabacteria bacterium]|nr:hypothetical protein [Candidatus Dadabacteria bacterium]